MYKNKGWCMRNRLEDLGRIMVLAKDLSDNEIYERYWRRPKDACDIFSGMTENQKDDCIHQIAYALEHISCKLSEIYCIAASLDDLCDNTGLSEKDSSTP